MRTAFFTVAAMLALLASGCQHHNLACNDCNDCNGIARPRMPGQPAYVGHLPHGSQHEVGPTGPATPTYAYPYYTTRAPRDFLQDNPMSIGR
jgi:hypothetical protein